MPFTIPNADDAFNANQAEPDSVDFDILVKGLARTSVVSGCAVAAQGTPDMTVAVAAGTVEIAGKFVSVAAGNGTITTADGSNPRFDLVTINASGTIVVTAGTAAAEPVFPAHPANVVVLAAVYVPTSDTTIANNQITDKRMVQHAGLENVRKTGSSLWYMLPPGQLTFSNSSGTFDTSANNADGVQLASPFPVANEIQITGYGVHVEAASDAALPKVKFCVYEDVGGFPGAVVTGSVSAAVAISSTGGKSVAISSFTLPPGMYWTAILCYDVDDGGVNPKMAGYNWSVSIMSLGTSTVPASSALAFDRFEAHPGAGVSTFVDPWTSTTVRASTGITRIRWSIQVA